MEEQKVLKQPIINKDTLIPMGAIVIIIGVAMWLTTIFNQTQTNTEQIVLLRADIVALEAQDTSVADRLARVETKLDAILSAIADNK